MSLFSQRKGLKPLKKALQQESLDEATRNRIWSVLKLFIWDKLRRDPTYDPEASAVQNLLARYWFSYFKKPSDTEPPFHPGTYYRGKSYYDFLREYFFQSEWNEVFDLIEFALANLPEQMTLEACDLINHVLTEENSAYRLVNNQFIEITNDSEVREVDTAAQIELDGVSIHISAAIKFLSDRKNPNYRNSIKESISAVESLFKTLTKSKSATLADGLKEMKKSIEIHPALLAGFEKIYAYTSDEDGIRHAIVDLPTSNFSDAKFMLVSCSAFINYVIGKFAENGKKIK